MDAPDERMSDADKQRFYDKLAAMIDEAYRKGLEDRHRIIMSLPDLRPLPEEFTRHKRVIDL